jgi:RNA recognition motif-containing protein
MAKTLYVGNISSQASENDLLELFQQAGPVDSLRILKDPYSGISRGFGFVEMVNQDDVARAISMFNHHRLKDKELIVNEARPRRTTERHGRGGSGRRDYFSGGTGRRKRY